MSLVPNKLAYCRLSQIQNPIEQDEVVRTVTKEPVNTVDLNKTIYVRTYSASAASVSGSLAATGQDDARVLQTIKPRWIIMYDADLGFIRRLELYKAANPTQPIKVFFMVYDNSVEERRYLSLVRKERSAFEKLIREKSNMAVPVDQDGRTPKDTEDVYWNDFDTRIGRGGGPSAPSVIVDLREFRCSLPSLLHARRLIIQPCTLEV
jgi:DNA excision repair protein ERCC-4